MPILHHLAKHRTCLTASSPSSSFNTLDHPKVPTPPPRPPVPRGHLLVENLHGLLGRQVPPEQHPQGPANHLAKGPSRLYRAVWFEHPKPGISGSHLPTESASVDGPSLQSLSSACGFAINSQRQMGPFLDLGPPALGLAVGPPKSPPPCPSPSLTLSGRVQVKVLCRQGGQDLPLRERRSDSRFCAVDQLRTRVHGVAMYS